MNPARAVLIMLCALGVAASVGCGDETSSEGGCRLYAVSTLPGGDLVVNGIDSGLVPVAVRASDSSGWSRGVGFPTRGFAVSGTRIAHLAATGTLAVADTTGTLVFEERLGEEATCAGCGGVVFQSDLAVLWQNELRWFDNSGAAAGQTTLPSVPGTSAWCACSLGATADGNLLIAGADPTAETLVTQVIKLARDGTVLWRWDSPEGVNAAVVGRPGGGVMAYGLQVVDDGTDAWLGWLDEAGNLTQQKTLTAGRFGYVQTLAEATDGSVLAGVYVEYATQTSTSRERHLLRFDAAAAMTDARQAPQWNTLAALPGGLTVVGRESVVPVETAWAALSCATPTDFTEYVR